MSYQEFGGDTIDTGGDFIPSPSVEQPSMFNAVNIILIILVIALISFVIYIYIQKVEKTEIKDMATNTDVKAKYQPISTASTAELGYVKGATSNIQQQITDVKTQYNNLQISNYTFKTPGLITDTNYYPIAIDTSLSWATGDMFEFIMSRAFVHSDDTGWSGSLTLQCSGHCTSHGHSSDFIKYDYAQHSNLLGHVFADYYTKIIVVYLMSGRTYNLSCNGCTLIPLTDSKYTTTNITTGKFFNNGRTIPVEAYIEYYIMKTGNNLTNIIGDVAAAYPFPHPKFAASSGNGRRYLEVEAKNAEYVNNEFTVGSMTTVNTLNANNLYISDGTDTFDLMASLKRLRTNGQFS
jgi:hypothetical protein